MDSPLSSDSNALKRMYAHRFDEASRAREDAFWDVFYAEFLSRRVGCPRAVLDLAAGSCGFINRVPAIDRYALDLNPDVHRYAASDVVVIERPADDTGLPDASIDLVFTSNFFEHLPTPDALLSVLGEAHRVLAPNGRVAILMPNLAAVGARYFDYLDHRLPLTDKSLAEALGLAGFALEELIPRTIPYGRNPVGAKKTAGPVSDVKQFQRMLRVYLRQPWSWRFAGGQMFAMARKP